MQVDPRARFDNYVVGTANRLAVAAARNVAESPGAAYNPLFVYSSSGLGKTHLLGAIGNHALKRNATLNVEYVALEDFVQQLHSAIATGDVDRFTERFGRVDVLLIDDMHFLTGRRETQSELLRLLNALQGGGRQIVMTSDRPPQEIPDVDEGLVKRLSGGLIVDIGAPDFETRVAILRGKCDERSISFAPGVIEELARVDFSNVRELQGAMNRLNAHQARDGMLTPAQVRTLMGARREEPVAGEQPAPSVRAASVMKAEVDAADKFSNFLIDIASALAVHVEPWKVRAGEASAYWAGEGYRTVALERLMRETSAPPNFDALLRGFGQAIEQLRELERQLATIDPELARNPLFRDPERLAEAASFVERVLAVDANLTRPNPTFTRAAYSESASNELAIGAADAVIAEPGMRYNPLYISGASGTGKTHLLHAIGNELGDNAANVRRIACVGAQLFVDQLIAALQEGTIEPFRASYRAADVLLIDDIQFIASKERTQEELFHLFNHFHSASKQLVFAGDVAPGAIEGLEERLRSRFEGGLVVELGAPDQLLRASLFARLLAQPDGPVSKELVAYLAERTAASIQEIIDIARRLHASAAETGAPLNLALARRTLEPASTAAVPRPPTVRSNADTFFLDDEKIVWEWPDVSGRLVEEMR